MNDACQLACLVGLAALPPVVLGLRAARPGLMPWWAVFVTMLGLGWLLVLIGAMLNETAHGGAGHVFALFFGWILVILWCAPWLLAYAVIQFVRRRRALPGASPPDALDSR